MPLVTDWILAIASIIAGIAGALAAFCAVWQIPQIKNELKNANQQLKNSVLTNVLSLETEMNSRKERVDDVSHEYLLLEKDDKLTEDINSIYTKRLTTALENWLNSIDRLCFCIKNEYLSEKDWKAEYRDYIVDVVREHESKFGAASKYKNIIHINDKWLRE
jgi:hypothetical protein